MHSGAPREYVTFASDQFSKEAKEHYINPCCQCEDVGIWIKDQVAGAFPTARIDLYQEDFGWVVDIHPQNRNYTIMVVADDLDEDQKTNEFGLYVDARESLFACIRRKLFRGPDPSADKRAAILTLDRSLHGENTIEHIRWWQGGFMCGDPKEHPIE